MKKTLRILAGLLAMLMLVCLSVPALVAAPEDDDDYDDYWDDYYKSEPTEFDIVMSFSKQTVKAGDELEITVSIEGYADKGPAITYLQYYLYLDTERVAYLPDNPNQLAKFNVPSTDFLSATCNSPKEMIAFFYKSGFQLPEPDQAAPLPRSTTELFSFKVLVLSTSDGEMLEFTPELMWVHYNNSGYSHYPEVKTGRVLMSGTGRVTPPPEPTSEPTTTEYPKFSMSFSANPVKPGDELEVTVQLDNYSNPNVHGITGLGIYVEIPNCVTFFKDDGYKHIICEKRSNALIAADIVYYDSYNSEFKFMYLPLEGIDDTIPRDTTKLFHFKVRINDDCAESFAFKAFTESICINAENQGRLEMNNTTVQVVSKSQQTFPFSSGAFSPNDPSYTAPPFFAPSSTTPPPTDCELKSPCTH